MTFERTEVVLDPSEVATDRVEVALNTGTIKVAPEGIDWGDAVIEQYLADQARGSLPVDFRVPNRQITIPLLLGADGPAGYAAGKAALQAKVALIQRQGGHLRRGTGLYADITSATLKLPDHNGHLGVQADVVLTLEALPDFYGDEIELDDSGETGDAVVAFTGIEGDYPARCRIVLTNNEIEPQRGVLWAVRSRQTTAAAPIVLTGAPELGGPLEFGPISDEWNEVATINAGHVGRHRIIARITKTLGELVEARLRWGVGDLAAAETNRSWTFPEAAGTYLADLGSILIRRLPVGTHAWLGSIEVRDENSLGTEATVVRVYVVPCDEGAGSLSDATAVIAADRTTEIRTDGAARETATPGQYAPLPAPRGDLPRLPVSGLEDRTVEVFVKPSRGDLDQAPDSATDTFTVAVYYRPSFLFPPDA